MKTYNHTTVLLQEAVSALNIKPDGIYVDCTLGGGGHSQAILDQLGDRGELICFEHDRDAWQNAPLDSRVTLMPENFRHIYKFLKHYRRLPVDGILADLGVSSHHFDIPERGFSYRDNGPLDMRMDHRNTLTAADVINEASEVKLVEIFSLYGEVSNSKTLARVIVEKREDGKIESVEDFLKAIEDVISGPPQKYLSKVFQALRIEVNEELESLKDLLVQSSKCLNKEGRLVIISFHSLEDRMVKEILRPRVINENPLTGQSQIQTDFELINKKPIVPSEDEQRKNKRSRSAKMRIAQKL